MSALILLAIVASIFGSLVGAGFTTYAEIYYIKAASDGIIDHHERKYLRHLFHGLKFGMTLVLLSGIALIVLEYLVPDAQQDVLVAPFWMIQTLTVLIIVLGYQLSIKNLSWGIGSSAILTGWWMIVALQFGLLNGLEYLVMICLYIFVTLIVAAVLGYIRLWVWHPHKIKEHS